MTNLNLFNTFSCQQPQTGETDRAPSPGVALGRIGIRRALIPAKMRYSPVILLAILLGTASCEKTGNNIPGNLALLIGDDLAFTEADLALYDSSAHILYFRTSHPEIFDYEKCGFVFYEDGEKIYAGAFWPGYLSMRPNVPSVASAPFFYPSYALKFEYNRSSGLEVHNEARLIDAFRKHGLLHSGLSATIGETVADEGKIQVIIIVTNHDVSDLLVLDPEKMGSRLFQYFTTGLFLKHESTGRFFEPVSDAIYPVPWDDWSAQWLSPLPPGSSKQFTMVYTMDPMPGPGTYRAFFTFPGLGYQVDESRLYQEGRRIWLGSVHAQKRIIIP